MVVRFISPVIKHERDFCGLVPTQKVASRIFRVVVNLAVFT